MNSIKGKIVGKILTGVLLISLAVLALRAATGWPEDVPLLPSCDYVTGLVTDPVLREELMNEIAQLRSNVCETIGFPSGNRSATRETSPLDQLSYNCLECHDGSRASTFTLRIRSKPSNAPLSLINIIGGHPVGMQYDLYAASSNSYRCDTVFPTAMVFAGGRVGCFTCHDPFNVALGHLVTDNDQSALCFTCHRK